MFFRKIPLAAAFFCMILLGSCHVFRKNTKAEPVNMPEVIVPANDPMEIYRASATKAWELLHTGIDIRFNLPQRTADAVTQLLLHPYYYSTDSVVLDAQNMKIAGVRDEYDHELPFRYDTLQLKVHLPRVYDQKDTLRLTIRYTAQPYVHDAGGSNAIAEDRGLYFINTDGTEPYQQVQIWTQGETMANSHWFPTFDKSNFRSTFRITMHVPDTFKTLSNGKLLSSVAEHNGLRADTWSQAIPIPPYLVMMAASNFAVARTEWKGKEVSYYVPQEYAPYARDIFNRTPEMIDFYSGLLGVPFPWDKYSQVVGYDYVSGAMENVSASLFGAFNLKDSRQLADDNNDFIVAHELFHQWFGDYVTAESWSNLTLNESFADYGEHLWSEHQYGEEARATVWQQGLTKYLTQSKWSDPPLVRFRYRSQEDMFDRISYSKGGLILHYLRQLTGDKAFFDALHLYLTQNALHSAEATQLRLAFEQVTGKDWNWFFDQWYYRGGHPVLDISYAYDDAAGKATATVIQLQADSTGLYLLPMKAQILSGNGSREVDWHIEKKKEVFTYDYINGQRPVMVPDARHWVPVEIRDHKSAAAWQVQYRFSDNHISKRLALAASADKKNNDTAQQVLHLALQDKDAFLRNMAVTLKSYEGNKNLSKDWISAIAHIAATDPDNKTKASALRALGDLKSELYISTYEQAISDSSYKVASAGLYALDKVNHKRAVDYARNLQPANMMGNVLLYEAATIIAKDGEKDDAGFFEQKTLKLFENNRMLFLLSVQEYLVYVKDPDVFSKGIDLLQKLALKNPDAHSSFYAGGILYNLRAEAEKQMKIATDKAVMEEWKSKKDITSAAWEKYKRAVKSENIRTEISRMEKE